jgi:DNA-binding PadR family transcriptional regulator
MEVLLGLLTVEPMSGYDLRQMIRGTVGHFWNESYGQIYPNLKTLKSKGLVISRTERQAGKPDRRIYSITAKGCEQLRQWLAVPPQPEIPRNELLLKLFFGEQVHPQILIEYVEHMAKQCRAILELLETKERDEIDRNQRYPAAPYWRMAVHYGQMELRSHLSWAEETLTELHRFANKEVSHAGTRGKKRNVGKRRSHSIHS